MPGNINANTSAQTKTSGVCKWEKIGRKIWRKLMTKLEELEAKRVAFSVARVATEVARGNCDVAMKTFEAAWIVKSTAFAAWCVAKAAYKVELDKQEN
jgi:hypothetical protein